MHSGTVVPPVAHLQFSRTEASLRPTLRNIRRPYIHINTCEGDLSSSTLALPSLPLSHKAAPWSLRRGWLPAALETVFPRRSSPSPPSRWPRHQRLRSKTFIVCAMQQGDEEGVLEPRHLQSLQPRASLQVHGLGGCRRARRIPPNRRLVARCEQRRSPLRQGDGRHMHGLTRWCGTPHMSRRGRRPISVLRASHPQVLQARHNRRCFQPLSVHLW
jgi:hypothetical protein